jgi:hypothetical protein
MRVGGKAHPEHPDVLNSQAIVFRKRAYVYQLFLGAEKPTSRRADLIAAARALAAQA